MHELGHLNVTKSDDTPAKHSLWYTVFQPAVESTTI